jgi:ribonuclease D
MKWIARQQDFDAMMDRVAAQPVIAVDTEADSLHSYFDKVCLIQISIPDEDFVVDPLAKIDIARFGAVLANPAIRKVFHGGDYDLRILNRDFGFVVTHFIDTMVCAQLLGYEAFGLAALLERHFGLKLNKAHQRADWAMRPLPPDMLDYAATDTRYLIRLHEILQRELEERRRWEWALEELSRMESIRYRERDADDEQEPFRRMKGIGGFDRRMLAVVRSLYDWRDALARQADRPPFKIIGNDAIIEVAKAKPQSTAELAKVKSVSGYHLRRYGEEIARLVRQAMALPEEQLPARAEARPFARDKVLEARIDKLKKVRDRMAKELGIDVSVVAPRHVLAAVATLQPKDVRDLDQVPAMREWQKRLLGEAFVAALA